MTEGITWVRFHDSKRDPRVACGRGLRSREGPELTIANKDNALRQWRVGRPVWAVLGGLRRLGHRPERKIEKELGLGNGPGTNRRSRRLSGVR